MSSGYPIKIFKQVHSSLVCPSCNLVMRDPTYTNGGRNSVCKICFVQYASIEQDKVTITIQSDDYKRNLIRNLMCYCKNRFNGCRMETKLGEKIHHEEGCEYAIIKCHLCSQEMLKRRTISHDCVFMSCICGERVEKKKKAEHKKFCSKHSYCYQCNEFILKSGFKAHMEGKNNPYFCLVCNDKFDNESEWEKHLLNDTGEYSFSKHTTNTAKLNIKMANLLQETRIELEKAKEEIEYLKTIKNGNFILKIEQVAHKLKEAETTNNKTITSPAFYSSQNGYKMQLVVYLNGYGEGEGSFISIYFAIVKGEWDGLLDWPFDLQVGIYILSLKKEKNVTNHRYELFTPEKDSPAFRKPVIERNKISGYSKFVSKTVYAETDYVNNDTMFIQIVVDPKELKNMREI